MSTLLYLDSFDHYDAADITRKWVMGGAGSGIVAGRNGYGLAPNSMGWYSSYVTIPGGERQTLTCGMARKLIGLGGIFIGFNSFFTGVRVALVCLDDGRLYVTVYVTGQSPKSSNPADTVLHVDEWYYVEMRAMMTGISPVSVSFVVRVNEAQVLSGSVTFPWGEVLVPGWNTVHTSSFPLGHAIVDDMYVTDDEFLGDIVIGVIRPNGVGLEEAWAPSDPSKRNWELTKEHSPDGDATYVEASYIGLMDRYDMDNITLPFGGVIKGIQGLVAVKKTDEGSCIIRPEYECLDDTWHGVNFYPSETSYIYARDAYRKNPISGVDFTVDQINSIRFGHKRMG